VLDFDHVAGKVALVSALVAWGAPEDRLRAEIAECEIRCCNCHRRVTADRRRTGRDRRSTVSGEPP
jgi:hypothetical protein